MLFENFGISVKMLKTIMVYFKIPVMQKIILLLFITGKNVARNNMKTRYRVILKKFRVE